MRVGVFKVVGIGKEILRKGKVLLERKEKKELV